jgi:WD40 repeat protein
MVLAYIPCHREDFMKTWFGLVLGVAACGGESTMMSGDDTIDPPRTLSALERCVIDGGSLKELWSVGNQHGPVTSIVAGPLVVLGAQDGSVKQWTVDGDEPSYGKPFTTAGATVAALAMSAEHILAATMHGEVAEWKLADASAAGTSTIADIVPSALALSADATRAFVGTTTGQTFGVDRATGTTTAPLQTTLWGVDTINVAGDRLYTAGHFYSTPQIERRIAIEPNVALDVWNEQQRNGHVRAVAVDAEGKRLVAAGDGFVATFAPDALAAGPLAITDVTGHTAVGAVMLPGGALFVTAGSEGTLRVWDVDKASPVAMLSIAAPIGVATDTAGTRLYTSGPDGRLHAFGCD